jgi:hypothetical protein
VAAACAEVPLWHFFIGLALALVVFGLRMNVVGNPHVVETVLDSVLAIAVWLTVWYQSRKVVHRLSRRPRSG